jgi:hypothetical protein
MSRILRQQYNERIRIFSQAFVSVDSIIIRVISISSIDLMIRCISQKTKTNQTNKIVEQRNNLKKNQSKILISMAE